MLRPLAFFHVIDKTDDFFPMGEKKLALQRDETSGKFVLYALTGWTAFLVGASRSLQPLPPPLVENRSALWAHAGFGQFLPCPVSVVSAFFIKDIVAGNVLETRGSGV